MPKHGQRHRSDDSHKQSQHLRLLSGFFVLEQTRWALRSASLPWLSTGPLAGPLSSNLFIVPPQGLFEFTRLLGPLPHAKVAIRTVRVCTFAHGRVVSVSHLAASNGEQRHGSRKIGAVEGIGLTRKPLLAERSAHPCLSGACRSCTDQAAGSSSSSAAAAAAVACTLSGLW